MFAAFTAAYPVFIYDKYLESNLQEGIVRDPFNRWRQMAQQERRISQQERLQMLRHEEAAQKERLAAQQERLRNEEAVQQERLAAQKERQAHWDQLRLVLLDRSAQLQYELDVSRGAVIGRSLYEDSLSGCVACLPPLQ